MLEPLAVLGQLQALVETFACTEGVLGPQRESIMPVLEECTVKEGMLARATAALRQAEQRCETHSSRSKGEDGDEVSIASAERTTAEKKRGEAVDRRNTAEKRVRDLFGQ